MPNSKIKDEITYEQPLIKEITDEETIKMFEDDNLFYVLKFMRQNNIPMTAEQLEDDFRKMGNEKSVKTIYRYLKTLKKAGLVVHAGKRISPSDKKLKTQILFLRSAKIFLPIKSKKTISEEEKRQGENILIIIGKLLGKEINKNVKSTKSLEEVKNQLINRRYEIYRNLLKNTDNEITDSVIKMDWKYIEQILESTSLFALFLDSTDWRNELLKCFE